MPEEGGEGNAIKLPERSGFIGCRRISQATSNDRRLRWRLQGIGSAAVEACDLSGKRRQQILFKRLLRIPRYLRPMPGQMERHVKTQLTLTQRTQQAAILPASRVVIRQITHMFAGQDKRQRAFNLLRSRRTALALIAPARNSLSPDPAVVAAAVVPSRRALR